MGIFFLAQFVIIIAETVVIDTAKKRYPGLVSHETACRRVGYTWTATWLLLTAWPFVEVYLRMGVLEWWRPLVDLASLVGSNLGHRGCV